MKPKRRKSAKKSAKPRPALIVQPNGRGALYAGGVPGNEGGTGRPPSVIRDRFREALDKRLPVLEDVADGQVMQRIEVPMFVVLKYARCPKCEGELVATEQYVGMELITTIEGRVSASPRDRLLAIKGMADVGMNSTRLDLEEIRNRLSRTLATIRTILPSDMAEVLIGALRPIWRAA